MLREIGMRVHGVTWGLYCAGFLLLGGCSNPFSAEQRALEANQARWLDAGLTDYRFRYQRLCFCGFVDPVFIEVRGGVISSVTHAETGEPVDGLVPDAFLTIDRIFAVIEDAIDRQAHELSVDYDPSLGYPRAVDIDYEMNAVDEEVSYRASDLEAR